ncbi:GNAT family N-acetyltransferase [Labrenzia sp. DG1229]|uniref:GNAT family N-acetyltransferase n=1 Tax=Labrenzia sp. DG1229 TaxID=681847 RepID=UPI00056203C8|nr:GNAT family N-acetyltransferase [Labrenzia sp. DG1229]
MQLGTVIASAEHYSHDELCDAMNRSFSDYAVPMALSVEGFSAMMRQRGLDMSASRVAIEDGRIVAVWLVSIREAASYLISSGTDPSYRRKDLAQRLALASLDDLKARGVANFQTEVFVENTGAYELYRSLGMQISRTLRCYDIPATEVASIIPGIRETSWSAVSEEVKSLNDVEPSWQNSNASVAAIEERVSCFAVNDANGLAGYSVLLRDTGTLAQLAVRCDVRKKGLGQSLVRVCQQGNGLRVLNVDSSSVSLISLMEKMDAVFSTDQYELRLLMR